MEWTAEIISSIQHLFPKQRGNVTIDYLSFFQALQHIAENGCKWRALPKEFGNWNSIYCRFRYWATIGVFDRIEEHLMLQAISIKGIKVLALDSTYVKVHPNGTGALKKTDRNPLAKAVGVGRPKSILLSRMKTYR
jgi:transposase